MSGTKVACELELTADHMEFLRSMKDTYGIPDEGKVVRIMVDYLLSNPDVHTTVFDETRCLWCG